MAYKGPDISSWQGNIDIESLASQVDFFIFRAYAGSSKDTKVDRNVKLAIAKNKPFGLYIYSYALNVAQAKEEAQRMINLANTYSVKPTFLCIDMEDADGYKNKNGMPSNEVLVNICKAECEVFKNAGYIPVVYASSSWFNGKLKNLSGYEKWVAHWPVSNGVQTGNNTSPNGENSNNCCVWQFTSKGTLNGYSGRLDMNYAYKDFVVAKTANNNQSTSDTPKETSTTGYTTKKGDYLSKIANSYKVDWQEIAKLNNIQAPKYIIYVGQELKIPTTSTTTNSNQTTSNTSKYTTGTYKVTAILLNVRSGAGTGYAIKTATQLTANAQAQNKKLGNARANGLLKGCVCTVTQVSNNWGKIPSGWICLDYCEKIK